MGPSIPHRVGLLDSPIFITSAQTWQMDFYEVVTTLDFSINWLGVAEKSGTSLSCLVRSVTNPNRFFFAGYSGKGFSIDHETPQLDLRNTYRTLEASATICIGNPR